MSRTRANARTAVAWIIEAPEYSKLAARVLAGTIAREAAREGVTSFLNSVETISRLGLGNARTLEFARTHAATLEAAIDREGDRRFEYFGAAPVGGVEVVERAADGPSGAVFPDEAHLDRTAEETFVVGWAEELSVETGGAHFQDVAAAAEVLGIEKGGCLPRDSAAMVEIA